MLLGQIFQSVLSLTQYFPTGPANGSSNTNKIATWCGKAYKEGDPAIDPGGRINPPVLSKVPLLDLKIQQRQSPYLESETSGKFIVDTSLSYIHGQHYALATNNGSSHLATRQTHNLHGTNASQLDVRIIRLDTGAQIASGRAPVDVSYNEFGFSLDGFRASERPYQIYLETRDSIGHSYHAFTQLIRLPNPPDGRAVTKIDNLYGSLLVQKNGAWTPIFPYTFYTASWAAKPSLLADFARKGYNVLHVIPGYDLDFFDEIADEAERLGLWIMYDMRSIWQNRSQVTQQVERYMKRKNLLLWYTADEPDGNVNPLGATKEIYDLIKSIDPYHPVSLVLNCANYFFDDYTQGADIIMTDPYPIGNNNSFSTTWHTVCNSTYGDCGCDGCTGEDSILNIPDRIDSFQTYLTQLGRPATPLWGVPQAFGNGEYWARLPTADEEAAMTMVGVNHGEKAIVMWTWPTSAELVDLTSRLGKVLINEVTKWILEGRRIGGAKVHGDKGGDLDVTFWIGEEEVLVSVVNTGREEVAGPLVIDLPDLSSPTGKAVTGTGVGKVFWGQGWSLAAGGSKLTSQGLKALEVDLFAIDTRQGLSLSRSNGGSVERQGEGLALANPSSVATS